MLQNNKEKVDGDIDKMRLAINYHRSLIVSKKGFIILTCLLLNAYIFP